MPDQHCNHSGPIEQRKQLCNRIGNIPSSMIVSLQNRRDQWKIYILVFTSLFVSCSNDAPPRDAIEAEIAVIVLMGERDPDRGRLVSSQLHVVIDGVTYPLEAASKARIIGFEGEDRITLSGRKVLVAGAIEDGVYMATYAKLLEKAAPTVVNSLPAPQTPASSADGQIAFFEREILELDGQIQAIQREIELDEAHLKNLAGDDPGDEMARRATQILIDTKKTQLESMKAHRDLQQERLNALEARENQ